MENENVWRKIDDYKLFYESEARKQQKMMRSVLYTYITTGAGAGRNNLFNVSMYYVSR